ncbi:MAG: UbiX family flavin prenyltransferase [Armatimonadetes bacterium]|nr:UbiX family flavin prenyltransferase [Armatimonadota bacterium]
MRTGRLVVAITGASGTIYAARLLRMAVPAFDEIFLTYSRQALQVAELELDLPGFAADPDPARLADMPCPNVRVMDPHSYFQPPASGSFTHDGMVIIPCSMGTAGRIAAGVSDNLVARAADVCLKERRPLVLVVRETPLSLIHLRNLTALTEAGAVVLPASPTFYGKPTGIDAMADTVAARALHQVGLTPAVVPPWQYKAP